MMRFQEERDLGERGIDFARLVGPRGWARLPAAIRRRFGHASPDAVRYIGTMHEVACSAAGFFLAQLCRLFGTPLAPWRGVDVPVAIALRPDPGSGGMVWERHYHYPGRRPIRVCSVKRLAPDGGLLECV